MKRWFTFAVILGCLGVSARSTAGDQGGHLILNGGGSKPDAVMEKFIELAGGNDGLIVVFPTASAEADTGEYYRDLLNGFGATNIEIAEVRSREQAQDAVLAELVRGAGGVWFSGGDQRRITEVLLDTAVGNAVGEAFNRGAVVGGTSAGTACQSELMITGDGNFEVITADNVELWRGLGLFKGVIVDQHFVARQRQNRLISVVLEHPDLIGVGVDEATAVWVRPDGTFEVLGEGWVVVFDASQARITLGRLGDDAQALGATGMLTHILRPGDIYDVAKKRVVLHGPRSR